MTVRAATAARRVLRCVRRELRGAVGGRTQLDERLTERVESPRTENVGQLAFGGARFSTHRRIEPAAPWRQTDEPRTPVCRIGLPRYVSQPLEVAQEVVHGLFRDVHLFRDPGGTLAVERLVAEHSHVRAAEIRVPRRDQADADPLADALPDVTQQPAEPRPRFPSTLQRT